MPTSSANPEHLMTFVTNAGQATDDLDNAQRTVMTAYEQFHGNPNNQIANPNDEGLFNNIQQFVNQSRADAQWVNAIHDMFLHADGAPPTLDDNTIASVLSSQGISDKPPQPLTVDTPVLNGLPLDSGFANDPVCTATGHFVESEDDFVMPPSLDSLVWRRV